MEVIIESRRSRQLRLARARKQRWRDRLSPESLDRLRKQNRINMMRRRQQETLEETQDRRRANAFQVSLRRQRDAQRRHESAANYQLVAERIVSQEVQDESQHSQVHQVLAHSCGEITAISQFCASKHFHKGHLSNGNFTTCCEDEQTTRAKKPWMLEHLQDSDGFPRLTGTKTAKFSCHV